MSLTYCLICTSTSTCWPIVATFCSTSRTISKSIILIETKGREIKTKHSTRNRRSKKKHTMHDEQRLLECNWIMCFFSSCVLFSIPWSMFIGMLLTKRIGLLLTQIFGVTVSVERRCWITDFFLRSIWSSPGDFAVSLDFSIVYSIYSFSLTISLFSRPFCQFSLSFESSIFYSHLPIFDCSPCVDQMVILLAGHQIMIHLNLLNFKELKIIQILSLDN